MECVAIRIMWPPNFICRANH